MSFNVNLSFFVNLGPGLFTHSDMVVSSFLPFRVNSMTLNGSNFHDLLNISITIVIAALKRIER